MTIEIKNISKSYGKKMVLDGVSFSVESGECIGILGENGSGKSTLFAVLTGLQRGRGSFFCDGRDLMQDPELRSRLVGFVPQNPPLINELTALDNLRLWYSKKELKTEMAEGVLKMLGIPDFAKTVVSRLSGGMKKRLSIGCSVAHSPKILFLDEPTAALDMVCKASIGEYLKNFTQKGGISVIATHDIYELSSCDRIYLLKQGKFVEYKGEISAEKLAQCLL